MMNSEKFEGPHLYEVGKLYSPTKRVWPEGYDYNFRAGQHELRLFMRTPHPQEIAAVRNGAARFSFSTFAGPEVLFLSFGFQTPNGGELNGDCSYSWWLVPEDERQPPSLDFGPTEGALLTVFLVDAENGILKVIRVIGLGHKFTLALHRAILAQAQGELPDDYDDQLRRVMARYTTVQLLNRGQRYRVGEVA